MSDPVKAMVHSVIIRQHNAAERMARIERKSRVLKSMTKPARQELAAACCEIISEFLGSCCPADRGDCDLSITILTLFEALVVSLRVNEDALFKALRAATPDQKLIDVTNFLTLQLHPKCNVKEYTLNHFTNFLGPVLFQKYLATPELVPETLMDIYRDNLAIQHKAGWEEGKGLRRIQYVDIVLCSGGSQAETQNFYQAVKSLSDYNKIPQAINHAKELFPAIYAEISAVSNEDDRNTMWMNYQAALLKSEQEVDDAFNKYDGDDEALAKELIRQLSDVEKCCRQCSNESNHKCSRCKSVYYCSLKCQKSHWPEHKKVCKKKI